MKKILFPEDEVENIRLNIEQNGCVWTVRVSNEYGKYSKGETLDSVFGKLKVEKLLKINRGIEELKEKYSYFNELNNKMIGELERHKKMDLMCLIKA